MGNEMGKMDTKQQQTLFNVSVSSVVASCFAV
jgi:hypothetical protein